ncbi:hypothetical protein [Streptomyces sp. KL116D]|uniref:hypothetical protein n=1 Tax=Streptomyces sp. KL116D TaxID=3045152 RepID=UPI003557AB8B
MAVLKQLHALPKPELPLGHLDPFVRAAERIDTAATLADDDRQWLRERLEDLKAQWASRACGCPSASSMGTPGSATSHVPRPARSSWDFERASFGPPEWTSCRRR